MDVLHRKQFQKQNRKSQVTIQGPTGRYSSLNILAVFKGSHCRRHTRTRARVQAEGRPRGGWVGGGRAVPWGRRGGSMNREGMASAHTLATEALKEEEKA